MIGSEARVYYVHRAKEASGGRETARHEKQRERTACSVAVERDGGGGVAGGGVETDDRGLCGGRSGATRVRVGNSNECTREDERDEDAERNARA